MDVACRRGTEKAGELVRFEPEIRIRVHDVGACYGMLAGWTCEVQMAERAFVSDCYAAQMRTEHEAVVRGEQVSILN